MNRTVLLGLVVTALFLVGFIAILTNTYISGFAFNNVSNSNFDESRRFEHNYSAGNLLLRYHFYYYCGSCNFGSYTNDR